MTASAGNEGVKMGKKPARDTASVWRSATPRFVKTLPSEGLRVTRVPRCDSWVQSQEKPESERTVQRLDYINGAGSKV